MNGADERHQQESRTQFDPGHRHRIVMAQVALVQRVEHRRQCRRRHAHPEAEVHVARDAADHQRHAGNHQQAEQRDYVVRSASR